MATTFGPGAGSTLVFARGTNIKFGEKSNVDTPLMNSTDFAKYTAAVNTASLTPASTLLTPGVIPTGVEQFAGAPGPFTITGTWTMDAVAKRMELIFRQLFNAPSAGVLYSQPATGVQQTLTTGENLDESTTSVNLDSEPAASQGPVQITVTTTIPSTIRLGGAAVSATNPLRIAVKGFDINGNELVNQLTYTAAGAQTTSSYFYTAPTGQNTKVVAVSVIGGTGDVGIAAAATANLNQVAITSSIDYRQTPGLTLEFVAGDVPSSLASAYLNTFALNVTRDAIATYTFGFVGSDFSTLGANMTGQQLTGTRASSTGAYGDGAFDNIQSGQNPFPGAAVAVFGENRDGTEVRLNQLEGLTLNFDNGTSYTNRIGSLFPGVAFNTQRTINLELSMELHKDDTDAAQAYLDARTWDNVRVRLSRLGGSNETVEFLFAQLQFSEFPVIPIEGDDYIRVTRRAIALPSASNLADAIQYRARYRYIDGTNDLTASNAALRSLS